MQRQYDCQVGHHDTVTTTKKGSLHTDLESSCTTSYKELWLRPMQRMSLEARPLLVPVL